MLIIKDTFSVIKSDLFLGLEVFLTSRSARNTSTT